MTSLQPEGAADMNWLPPDAGPLDLDGLQVGGGRGGPRGVAWSAPEPRPCPPRAAPPCAQNYFGQGQAGALADPLLMQAQIPFRGGPGLPGGFVAPPPSANLFSSIPLPDAGLDPLGAGADDSGDSSGGAGPGGKKSAEQRAAAVQEKNRRAQKRFRERQASRARRRRTTRRPTPLLALGAAGRAAGWKPWPAGVARGARRCAVCGWYRGTRLESGGGAGAQPAALAACAERVGVSVRAANHTLAPTRTRPRRKPR